MRKTFVLLILFVSSAAVAQVKFSKNLADVQGFCSDFELVAYVTLTNNSKDSVFVWERTKNDRSEGWESAVCDNKTCYGSGTSSGVFELNPNDSFTFRFYYYPSKTKGVGNAEIVIHSQDNPENRDTLEVSGACWGVSLHETGIQNVSIYPNPAKNYIYVKGMHTAKTKFSGYDLLGNLVLEGPNFDEKGIEVRDLNSGMYLIKLETENHQSFTKVFRKN
ncbi:MAG: T9SS type A sorting domain-containing protein [Bacteroidota bacterium]|nr:T9SS type A sorting domain-containing protein [Bacteroidota bacterium]